jgi:hypothetical protein
MAETSAVVTVAVYTRAEATKPEPTDFFYSDLAQSCHFDTTGADQSVILLPSGAKEYFD